MAAGAAYFGLWTLLMASGARGGGGFLTVSIGYLIGLAPVRVAEWWFLLWLFYDRQLRQKRKDWNWVALGTGYSYALDIPALLGFCITGGAWIC
jgi:hypothetical protein